MELPGFVGPSYELRGKRESFQRTLNLYPERNEMAPKQWSLTYTPGLRLIVAIGTGPIRGLWRTANNRAFAVSGNELYEITTPTAPVSRGALGTNVGTVKMRENAFSLVIVDGTYGYSFEFSTNVLTRITDTDFPAASSVEFLDQYIIVNDEGTGSFQFSALNDATNWDALDLASAEASPDNLIALAVDHRQLILFGDVSTEVWFDSGDASNPFQRINGAFIERGIAGKHLHSLADNTRLWWSKDSDGQAIAVRMNGYNAERISTINEERKVQTYGDISGGTCWSYQDSGHTFWCTNFPRRECNASVGRVNRLMARALLL
jgi:hypothetical protein